MAVISNAISSIMPIIIAVLVFCVLVVVHEFGHFIVAKRNGIYVEEFSVGMGMLLFSKQIGETQYSIRALPIGGFCKMMGEDEDSKDKRAFNNKGIFARISVIAAGPFMNFIFAFIIIFFLLCSSSITKPIVSKLIPEYPAESVGMQVGDEVVKVSGHSVFTHEDMQIAMDGNSGEEIEVVVKRDGEKLKFKVNPIRSPETGAWLIGFEQTSKSGAFAKEVEGFDKAGIGETLVTSFFTMISYIKSTVIGFVRIFTFNVTPEEMAGPIGIIQIIGESYEIGLKSSVIAAIQNIAYLAALLSANLGALNLFPIPAMDGGRLTFLFLEGLRGKPINPEKEGMIHFVGFVLLMAFMIFVAYNDIAKLFA